MAAFLLKLTFTQNGYGLISIMTKIRKVSLVFITLCGFMNTLQEADCALNGAGSKPNILIIFTDDQGYGDLACYGNKKIKHRALISLPMRARYLHHFILKPSVVLRDLPY